jgi:hypothetical protein
MMPWRSSRQAHQEELHPSIVPVGLPSVETVERVHNIGKRLVPTEWIERTVVDLSNQI